jgi:hypothetical protein
MGGVVVISRDIATYYLPEQDASICVIIGSKLNMIFEEFRT